MPTLKIGSEEGGYSSLLLTGKLDDRSPAILLFPAVAGVNDYILNTARRLNDCGYAVLVLDYYAREGKAPDVSTPDQVVSAVESLSDLRVMADARAAIQALGTVSTVDSSRIGALGFCIGGTYAMMCGCESLGIKASVNYYGTISYASLTPTKPISPLERLTDLSCPLLAHFGTYDRLISNEQTQLLERTLQTLAKPYELFRYYGAPHAFDENFRPAVFRAAASAAAWGHTTKFLNWHLRSQATR